MAKQPQGEIAKQIQQILDERNARSGRVSPAVAPRGALATTL